VAARTSGGALTRVPVWFAQTQVDLALPAREPIATYIDDVVEVMGQQVDLPAAPVGQWTLARPDRPLKIDTTLAEARIEDGALLELRLVAPTERYRPVIEDVVDAVAAEAAATTTPFDAAAARTAGLVALALGGVGLCAGQWAAWAGGGYRWLAAVIGMVLAAAALGAMWSAQTRYRSADAAAAWSVVWIGWATTVAQLVPVSVRTGRPGLAHFVIAAVAVAAAALVALGILRRHTAAYSALIAGALVAAVAVGVVVYGGVSGPSVAAGALAVGLIGLSVAPRLATMLAGISLPRVPAPEEDVDVAADTSDAQMRLITARAERAVQYTLGLTAAVVAVITVAAAFVLDPHSTHRRIQIAIVVATVIVLVLTARMLSDRRLSWAMLAGAGGVAAVSVGRLLVGWPHGVAPAVVLGVAAAMLGVGVFAALVVVRRAVPETVSAWINRLRLAALTLAFPLCVWATGVFGAIRDLSFR
jgi:type VII secretion integral membrane protein EccD